MKELKLIEAFSGIGTQAMALKHIHNNVNVLGFSEIDRFAIQSYNLIHGDTHNFGNIKEIHTFPYADIITYSFPCQDLSNANVGGKGLDGTQSGLVWDFLNVINRGEKPKVLVMENVKALNSQTNKPGFDKIKEILVDMGYTNYVDVLSATEFNIPQSRQRVFMVSILGEHNPFEFPKPIGLHLTMQDLLETTIPANCVLTEQMGKYLTGVGQKESKFDREERFSSNMLRANPEIANTLITREGNNTSSNYVFTALDVESKHYLSEKMKAYVVADNDKWTGNKKAIINRTIASTINTGEGSRRCDASNYESKDILERDVDISGLDLTDIRIRKLTPRECWRLMGIDDKYFNKVEKHISVTQLKKQAGNAIVVPVLEALFTQVLESIDGHY